MDNTILFVDDELQILKALKRIFMKRDYKKFYAQSAEEALNIMDVEDIDIIVTDIRMPDVDGYELLGIVEKHYPEIFRVALSGYTDEIKIRKALEMGITKLYLFKPWKNIELVKTIDKIINLKDILSDENYKEASSHIIDYMKMSPLYDLYNSIGYEEDLNSILDKLYLYEDHSREILDFSNVIFHKKTFDTMESLISEIGNMNLKYIFIFKILIDMVRGSCEDSIADNIESRLKDFSIMNGILYEDIMQKTLEKSDMLLGLFCDISEIVQVFYEDSDKNDLRKISATLISDLGMPVSMVESQINMNKKELSEIIELQKVCLNKMSAFYLEEIPFEYVSKCFEVLEIKQEYIEERINHIPRDLK